MRFTFLTLSILALATTSGHATPSPKIPKLVMTSPDSASIQYESKCGNGGNSSKLYRDRFVELMLANKKSKLSKLKVALLNEIKKSGEEPRGEGVYIGEWNQTFHERGGCGSSLNSYSAFIYTVTGGNANYTVVKYLVTIDDDDSSGKGTLKILDIRPITIKLRNDIIDPPPQQ